MAEVILDNQALLKDYLLGRLGEEDQVRIESRYFIDDDFLEELQACEFDLIDSYLAGKLTAEDSESFEQFFLTIPGNQEKLANARLLAAAKTRPAEEVAPSGWRKFLNSLSALSTPGKLALGLAFLLLVVLGGTLIFQALRQPKGPNAKAPENPPEQPSPQQQAPEQKFAQENPPPEVPSQKRPAVATATLIPNLMRSGGGKRNLKIFAETETVTLTLTLVTGYQSYSVSVQKADGTEVFQSNRVAVREGKANISFPAQKLSNGDYVVILKGTSDGQKYEHVQDYQFRASRN